jgi:hypothetical protein
MFACRCRIAWQLKFKYLLEAVVLKDLEAVDVEHADDRGGVVVMVARMTLSKI